MFINLADVFFGLQYLTGLCLIVYSVLIWYRISDFIRVDHQNIAMFSASRPSWLRMTFNFDFRWLILFDYCNVSIWFIEWLAVIFLSIQILCWQNSVFWRFHSLFPMRWTIQNKSWYIQIRTHFLANSREEGSVNETLLLTGRIVRIDLV